MSTPYTEAGLTGKMCYIRTLTYAGAGKFNETERAKCLDYNDRTNIGVFMLRGGTCVVKNDTDIVSVATDQSPFSQPEPSAPVTARSILAKVKAFFTT